jgi:hypothetical protein
MSSYYANTALASWQAQQDNYQNALDAYAEQQTIIEQLNAQTTADWEAACAAVHTAWEEAHAAWVADPGDPPQPEPIEPVNPPAPPPQPAPREPTPPDAAVLSVYEAREVTEPEQLETATGTALILPPRVVLTGTDGVAFALSSEELAAGYADTTTVTL